ncbi:C-type lectin domain family 4 member M-like [Clarias gariepinus]|uniref:C-type lectin domain family 4 member M-like n=1 Tax=Clarias gariepinus TaxID=13013 RepID=UPI00234C9168|nr:C-type lectin domain family 4 member M-like [Clarias gariepinus]
MNADETLAGGATAWSRCCTLTAVCELLFCVLLMAAVTLLWIKFNNVITENNQLQTSYDNLTIERDQLQTSYNTLTKVGEQLQASYNNLTIERDQLQTSYNNLTKVGEQLQASNNNLTIERDQLQTSYNNLTKVGDQLQASNKNLTIERDQLQNRNKNLTVKIDQLQTSYGNLTIERDQLQISYDNLTKVGDQLQASNKNLTIERDQLQTSYHNLIIERDQLQRGRNGYLGKFCDLEKCFIFSSFYFMSNEYKNWTESREDCIKRGADLVIINSREEQEFISKQKVNKKVQAWIGLSDRETEGEWKWVDNTTLNITFWASREPNNSGGDEDCAEIYSGDTGNFWNDKKCSEKINWICEKHLS